MITDLLSEVCKFTKLLPTSYVVPPIEKSSKSNERYRAVISMRGAARAVAARKPSPAPRERDLIERGPLVKEPLER